MEGIDKPYQAPSAPIELPLEASTGALDPARRWLRLGNYTFDWITLWGIQLALDKAALRLAGWRLDAPTLSKVFVAHPSG